MRAPRSGRSRRSATCTTPTARRRIASPGWRGRPLGATHHLHLTEPGSDLWRERLAFRDALRADPALLAEYAAWKREHVSADLAAGTYTADKRPLVERVLAERGIPLRPDEERLEPALLAERARR